MEGVRDESEERKRRWRRKVGGVGIDDWMRLRGVSEVKWD